MSMETMSRRVFSSGKNDSCRDGVDDSSTVFLDINGVTIDIIVYKSCDDTRLEKTARIVAVRLLDRDNAF